MRRSRWTRSRLRPPAALAVLWAAPAVAAADVDSDVPGLHGPDLTGTAEVPSHARRPPG